MINKRIPNLFIVGAMKSGTTSLHNYLDTHPNIFMSKKPKETQYFVKELNWSRGEDWYLSLFDAADSHVTILGESSTDYTKLPLYQGVVQRIADFNPEARIIYIMRDPVERSISNYWWQVQFSAEGRDMLTVMKKVKDITDISYYAMQIKPYIEMFGRERVMALTLEELKAAPIKTLQNLFDWLGVDSSFVPPSLEERYNVSPKAVPTVRGARVISQLRGTPVWDWLKQSIPPSTKQKLMKILSRPVDRDESYVQATIEYLRPIQQQQTEELSQLLGRDFPEWKTLYGTNSCS